MGIWRFFKQTIDNYRKKSADWFKDSEIRIIMLFTLAIGLVLTCLADKIGEHWWPLSSGMSHFGSALIIASIIAYLLELTAVRDFIETSIVNILFKDEAIKSMNLERLIDLNFSTMKAIGKLNTGNPLYEYSDFVTQIQSLMLENIGAIYRKDLSETIHYSLLTSDEKEKLNIDGNVVRITRTTKFKLIAPFETEGQEFTLPFNYELNHIPGLAANKQLSLSLAINLGGDNTDGISYIENIDVDINQYINKDGSSFCYQYKNIFKYQASFSAYIEYTTQEYQYELPGHLKSSMNLLTHGATIHFASRDELALIDAEFFGLTGYSSPVTTPNSISIQYSDWALPEDGYFISWQKKPPELP
ncbi:MAG: hypothetical protein ACLQBD_10605 [Syntrophobacteraceae bacterium]